MHFYAIRADLTGFQHVHPSMAADGTWSADLSSLAGGSWRMFASFAPNSGTGKDFVLSRTVTVPGDAAKTPLAAPATITQVDGYTVTVKGELMAGMAHPLTVSIAKDGKPVTDLEPYQDTYAHLTAFHDGEAAFAHLHPTTKVTGNHGGPDLSFHAGPSPVPWLPTGGPERPRPPISSPRSSTSSPSAGTPPRHRLRRPLARRRHPQRTTAADPCLELGSSTGLFASLLSTVFPQVISVDLSLRMLQQAHGRSPVRVQADRGTWTVLRHTR
ncbi:hypothetical protein ACFXOD_33155 [Streptomyces sp. NPDC059161]|uniref:hypothetical protein n=1 Tax=Streptomyces sp. NPDC059161 TaxID=3346749 RepID=UPI0036A2C9E7